MAELKKDKIKAYANRSNEKMQHTHKSKIPKNRAESKAD